MGVYSKRGGPHGGRGVAEPHGQHGGLGFRGKTKLGEERGVPRPLRAEAVTGKGPPCGPVRGPSPLRWSRRSPKEGRRLPGRGARDRRCCAETPSRAAQSGRGAGPSPSGLLFSCSSAPPPPAKDPSRPEQGRACALGGRTDRKEGERMRPERLSAQVSGAWAGLALGSGSSPDPAEERGGPGRGEGRGWPVCGRGGRARGTAGPPLGPSRASRAARGGAKAWTAL